MLSDAPKKKKIVLRSHKKGQLSVQTYTREVHIPTTHLENINCQQISITNIANSAINNNSLEIYEDDRRHGFMFLMDTEEDRGVMEEGPQVQPQQKFSLLKRESSKETSINWQSEKSSLYSSQILTKMQSPPSLIKSFHKKGCISVSLLSPRPGTTQNRTKSLVTSPNKQFLQITLKSASNSPSSSFVKKNVKIFSSEVKQRHRVNNNKQNVRPERGVSRNLIQLSNNCLNFKILRRCNSRSDKVTTLAIKSRKYGELQAGFNKKLISKCNSIRMLTKENGLNK